MEISDTLPEDERETGMQLSSGAPVPSRQSLPPKGSCWYCEKPLDSVKRFCGRGCADAFDEEAEFTR